MYNYNKKTTSLIFGICLMLGIIIFGVFGATFAYFQIENKVDRNFYLGKVGAVWYQGGINVTGNEININTESGLVHGDSSGVNIQGGTLKIKALEDTVEQYVRVTYIAYVETSKGSGVFVEDSGITSELVMRVGMGTPAELVALNATGSDWKKGEGENWYYYKEPINETTTAINVCDNIVLNTLAVEHYEKQLKIKFIFETLQKDNNPVESMWGASAKAALGV